MPTGRRFSNYVNETARPPKTASDAHIRFRSPGGHRRVLVVRGPPAWTLDVDRERRTLAASALSGNVSCTCAVATTATKQGYDAGVRGYRRLSRGEVVHPQEWPGDARLQPARTGRRHRQRRNGHDAWCRRWSKRAAEVVTMVQRYADLRRCRGPTEDSHRQYALRQTGCPEKWAYALTRWKNVALSARGLLSTGRVLQPGKGQEQRLLGMVRDGISAEDYVAERHFTPRYNPWDQRLCLIPNDGSVSTRYRAGKASVVTGDTIDTVHARIRLAA